MCRCRNAGGLCRRCRRGDGGRNSRRARRGNRRTRGRQRSGARADWRGRTRSRCKRSAGGCRGRSHSCGRGRRGAGRDGLRGGHLIDRPARRRRTAGDAGSGGQRGCRSKRCHRCDLRRRWRCCHWRGTSSARRGRWRCRFYRDAGAHPACADRRGRHGGGSGKARGWRRWLGCGERCRRGGSGCHRYGLGRQDGAGNWLHLRGGWRGHCVKRARILTERGDARGRGNQRRSAALGARQAWRRKLCGRHLYRRHRLGQGRRLDQAFCLSRTGSEARRRICGDQCSIAHAGQRRARCRGNAERFGGGILDRDRRGRPVTPEAPVDIAGTHREFRNRQRSDHHHAAGDDPRHHPPPQTFATHGRNRVSAVCARVSLSIEWWSAICHKSPQSTFLCGAATIRQREIRPGSGFDFAKMLIFNDPAKRQRGHQRGSGANLAQITIALPPNRPCAYPGRLALRRAPL